jgi:WD40 repeat protein
VNSGARTAAFFLLIAFLAVPGSSARGQGGGKPGWVFQDIIPGGHRGPVQALAYTGDKILSAGNDGFLEIWNLRTGAAEQRFQVSPYRINAMALRPGKPELCLIESDGLGLYRISVWDYAEMVNKFTLRFRDPIGYVNYSAGGGFIIAARSGRTGLVFLHPETGEPLQSPQDLTGMIGFAATGRSERNMIVYFSWGSLSYWDLRSGTETGSFDVPSGLGSPVIFGNNRFFAGLDGDGLVVIDAVSGDILADNSAIPPDSFLFAGEGVEFFCLAQDGELYRFAMDARRLVLRERRILSGEIPVAAAAAGDGVVLGDGNGGIRLLDRRGQARELTVKNQRRIIEAAVSGSRLAFITEDKLLGFLSLDYFRLDSGEIMELEGSGGYTRLLAFPGASGEEGRFLLWQPDNVRQLPIIRSAGRDGSVFPLRALPLRVPLRSAAVFGEKTLFLDSAGNMSVISVNTAAQTDSLVFSFSSIGSLDAAFANQDHVVLGRSGVSGNSPFLMINVSTGETVPLPYPSSAGARVYRGESGTLYAAAVDEEEGRPRTSIIRLDTAYPAGSVRLVEYQGEDILFSLAESSRVLASTLGDSGATLFSSGGMKNFERSPGLPAKIVGGADFFIVIDGDGNICWHDPRTGELLALLRLYANEWILQQNHGGTIWGTVTQP